jgi:hypothetical protein
MAMACREGLKEKVISCHGNLNIKSTAKLCKCSEMYVYMMWKDCGFDVSRGANACTNYID